MNGLAELYAQRRVTTDFIASNPTSLALIEAGKVKTAAGGTVRANGPTRVAQTFRVIDQSTASGGVPGPLRTADGVSRRATHQLLGAWDADMAVGDHWIGTDGKRYEIVEVLPENGYERRGRVIAYG